MVKEVEQNITKYLNIEEKDNEKEIIHSGILL